MGYLHILLELLKGKTRTAPNAGEDMEPIDWLLDPNELI